MYKLSGYFKIGDKVNILGNASLSGEVILISYPLGSSDRMYHVKFDNTNLIPNTMEYKASDLELITELPTMFTREFYTEYDAAEIVTTRVQCECGVHKLGYGKHSPWCNLVWENESL